MVKRFFGYLGMLSVYIGTALVGALFFYIIGCAVYYPVIFIISIISDGLTEKVRDIGEIIVNIFSVIGFVYVFIWLISLDIKNAREARRTRVALERK